MTAREDNVNARGGPLRVLGFAAVLVGISSGCASKAQPPVPTTQTSAPITQPALPATQPAVVGQGPESSGISTPPTPPPYEGSFWWPDKPVQLRPTAFGKVVPVGSQILIDKDGNRFQVGTDGTRQAFSIDRFVLATVLPKAPAELPVYITGVYAPSHTFNGPPGWDYGPQGALVWNHHRMEAPPGPDPAARAAALFQQYDLLLPDSREPKTFPGKDGSTSVVFFRHVAGMPVYGDKPACASFDKEGALTSFDFRRRPLLEVSQYPTRTPRQAWSDLQQGKYLMPGGNACRDGGTWLAGTVKEFRVTSVELAYWEHHADRPRQTMIPYYVFRSSAGATLYVPAIAPEWVQAR